MSDLEQERSRRLKIMTRVHGYASGLMAFRDARRRDTVQHCDCSRCGLLPMFRDQFDWDGTRRRVGP